jgi:hypothetical protein
MFHIENVERRLLLGTHVPKPGRRTSDRNSRAKFLIAAKLAVLLGI